MAAASKTIILITGGNAGIGFELAAQLIADETKHVLIGSRSLEKGNAALKDLQSRDLPGSVELLQLDVDNKESIAAAAKKVESDHGRVDGLVNNAAIAWLPDAPIEEAMAKIYHTNVIGPWLMGEAFQPLLKKSITTPRIVNVSSGAGSIGRKLDPAGKAPPSVPYSTSKAALNMVNAYQAVDYGKEGFKVFAYCPGFTVSTLGPYNTEANGAKSVADGTSPIVKILNGHRDAEHGGFLIGEEDTRGPEHKGGMEIKVGENQLPW